jgi:hypothetical protein
MTPHGRLMFALGWALAEGAAPVIFAADVPPTAPHAVATYECLGVYWARPVAGPVTVQFRREGATGWQAAQDLVYDARDGEYRGSIVGLTPDTNYEVKLSAGGMENVLQARTRSDRFPVGETTTLPSGDSTESFTISKSGTADAYHLVTVPPAGRTSLDAAGRAVANITVDADFVIIRGLELRNAAQHGVLIKAGHHDIVVENCHITGWGRNGGPRTLGGAEGDQDSAVYAEKGAGRLTVQRNLIEHPRGASNDWETGHPSGPQGVSLINSSGGNVIRYNDITSTEDHGFNDGIGGGSNFSREGSPNRDSDIYGNFIRNCWDDAIESEGANMNVRIWGNYLQLFYNGIATAATSRGPLYIFRNVWAESRRTHRDSLGGAAIKTGERDEFGGGRKYVFHNTVVQPAGVFTAFTSHVSPNTVSRNNIFDVRGALATRQEKPPASDYDYDFFSGGERGTAAEAHGRRGATGFLPSHRLEFYPAAHVTAVKYGKFPIDIGGGQTREVTDPVVSQPNPVIDAGAPLPNFNDDFAGKAPDLGAFEIGRPPLEFGRRAYLRWDEGWAPWETVR